MNGPSDRKIYSHTSSRTSNGLLADQFTATYGVNRPVTVKGPGLTDAVTIGDFKAGDVPIGIATSLDPPSTYDDRPYVGLLGLGPRPDDGTALQSSLEAYSPFVDSGIGLLTRRLEDPIPLKAPFSSSVLPLFALDFRAHSPSVNFGSVDDNAHREEFATASIHDQGGG